MYRPSARQYRTYWVCPVFDDDTELFDYWDVHEPADDRFEGDPIGSFSTLDRVRSFVDDQVRMDAITAAFDRIRLPA